MRGRTIGPMSVLQPCCDFIKAGFRNSDWNERCHVGEPIIGNILHQFRSFLRRCALGPDRPSLRISTSAGLCEDSSPGF